MFDLYPRLRTIVEPTLFSYRLKIIDDDLQLKILFDDSFRVKGDIRFNTEKYINYRRDFLNEPFKLQHSLKYIFSKLSPKTKEPGCSLNVFFITAISRAFFIMHGKKKGDTVGIRLSYDLRPYFEKEMGVLLRIKVLE